MKRFLCWLKGRKWFYNGGDFWENSSMRLCERCFKLEVFK